MSPNLGLFFMLISGNLAQLSSLIHEPLRGDL